MQYCNNLKYIFLDKADENDRQQKKFSLSIKIDYSTQNTVCDEKN